MKHFFVMALTVLFFFFLRTAAAEPLNIVVILADDLGWRDMSHAGSGVYETPRIDELASTSMRFTQAYSAHPRCVPARWALMTGKFPARGGVPGRAYNLDPEEETIAEALKKGGYKTFFAGKWHLQKTPDQAPEKQGFDINIAGGHAGAPGSYFFPYLAKNGKGKEKPIQIEGGNPGDYLPDHLSRETIDFIRSHHREHPEQPFFVYLSHYAVHTPLEAKAEKVQKFSKKIAGLSFEGPEFLDVDGTTKQHQNEPVYAAMLESLDESVGAVLDELKALGLEDNTLVVFTSDHGGLSNRGLQNNRPLATSNLPLRAGKGHCYEGGIRVPFLLRWPGRTPPGSENPSVVMGTDLYPTLLAAAGLDLLPEQHLDGLSLEPAASGRLLSREAPLFWHSPRGRPNNTGDRNCTVIRAENWKLVDYFDDGQVELYDLSSDPYEQQNLAESKPEIRNELLGKIRRWREENQVVMGK